MQVALLARNCPEWVIAEQGLYSQSMVSVPLYSRLGSSATAHALTECEVTFTFPLCEKF